MEFLRRCVLVVAALMIGCMLLAACEEQEELTPLEALLKAATLERDDFPSGFTLDEESFSTTEERAESDPIDPQETLNELNEWGHLLAYHAVYSKEWLPEFLIGSITGFYVFAEVYQDASGARAAMAGQRERLEDPEVGATLWARSGLAELGFGEPLLSPMSFANIGDETYAFQFTTPPSLFSLNEFEWLGVLIREDRLIGGIQRIFVGSRLGELLTTPTNGGSPVEQLEELTRKLHERMKAALKEPPQPSEG